MPGLILQQNDKEVFGVVDHILQLGVETLVPKPVRALYPIILVKVGLDHLVPNTVLPDLQQLQKKHIVLEDVLEPLDLALDELDVTGREQLLSRN